MGLHTPGWTLDPHEPAWEWHYSKHGEVLLCSRYDATYTYCKTAPGPSRHLWTETPERLALWVTLMLEAK